MSEVRYMIHMGIDIWYTWG